MFGVLAIVLAVPRVLAEVLALYGASGGLLPTLASCAVCVGENETLNER